MNTKTKGYIMYGGLIMLAVATMFIAAAMLKTNQVAKTAEMINVFDINASSVVNNSNGIITNLMVSDKNNEYIVKVSDKWQTLSTIEKQEFALETYNAIKSLEPNNINQTAVCIKDINKNIVAESDYNDTMKLK